MAVYLVRDSVFLATVSTISTTQTVAESNFDVGLHPKRDCEKSAKFYSDINAALYLSQQESTDFRNYSINGIWIKFIHSRRIGTNTGTGEEPSNNDVGASKHPTMVTVQVGGIFLEEGWKNYKKPVNIKVEFTYFTDTDTDELILVSEDLRLPFDLTDNAYTFEDAVVEPSCFNFSKFSKLSGELTIQLLEYKPPCNVEINKKILDDKIQSDFALIATNENRIACHSNFLAAHSIVFKTMFEGDYKESKERTFKINMTEEAVNALLKFLYCSDLDAAQSSSSISFERLEAAHKYDMPSLENAVQLVLMDKPNSWYDLGTVIDLFQLTWKIDGYRDLKEKAVKVIQSKPTELRASTAFQDLFQADSETANELFLHCLNK